MLQSLCMPSMQLRTPVNLSKGLKAHPHQVYFLSLETSFRSHSLWGRENMLLKSFLAGIGCCHGLIQHFDSIYNTLQYQSQSKLNQRQMRECEFMCISSVQASQFFNSLLRWLWSQKLCLKLHISRNKLQQCANHSSTEHMETSSRPCDLEHGYEQLARVTLTVQGRAKKKKTIG